MKCPNCDELLIAVWDNVGFEPPEGPDHWEIEKYVCEICGYTDENEEADVS